MQQRRFISYYERINTNQHNLIFDMFQDSIPIFPNPEPPSDLAIVVEQHSRAMQFSSLMASYWQAARGISPKAPEQRSRIVVLNNITSRFTVPRSSLTIVLIDAAGPHQLRREDGMALDYRITLQRVVAMTGRAPLIVICFDKMSASGVQLVASNSPFAQIFDLSPTLHRRFSMRMLALWDHLNAKQHNMLFGNLLDASAMPTVADMYSQLVIASEPDTHAESTVMSIAALWQAAWGPRRISKMNIPTMTASFEVDSSALVIVVIDANGRYALWQEADTDYDYRMVLWRLFAQTGRLPWLVVCRDATSVQNTNQQLSEKSSVARMLRSSALLKRFYPQTIAFHDEPNPKQTAVLQSLIHDACLPSSNPVTELAVVFHADADVNLVRSINATWERSTRLETVRRVALDEVMEADLDPSHAVIFIVPAEAARSGKEETSIVACLMYATQRTGRLPFVILYGDKRDPPPQIMTTNLTTKLIKHDSRWTRFLQEKNVVTFQRQPSNLQTEEIFQFCKRIYEKTQLGPVAAPAFDDLDAPTPVVHDSPEGPDGYWEPEAAGNGGAYAGEKDTLVLDRWGPPESAPVPSATKHWEPDGSPFPDETGGAYGNKPLTEPHAWDPSKIPRQTPDAHTATGRYEIDAPPSAGSHFDERRMPRAEGPGQGASHYREDRWDTGALWAAPSSDDRRELHGVQSTSAGSDARYRDESAGRELFRRELVPDRSFAGGIESGQVPSSPNRGDRGDAYGAGESPYAAMYNAVETEGERPRGARRRLDMVGQGELPRQQVDAFPPYHTNATRRDERGDFQGTGAIERNGSAEFHGGFMPNHEADGARDYNRFAHDAAVSEGYGERGQSRYGERQPFTSDSSAAFDGARADRGYERRGERDRDYGGSGDRGYDRRGDRDRDYGGNERDRDYGGSDRNREYGGSGDRGYNRRGERDREYGGDRGYDRSDRDRDYGGSERDRDYGGSGDRGYGRRGDRDRDYGGSDWSRDYGGSDRDRDYGGGDRDREYGGSDRDRDYGGSGDRGYDRRGERDRDYGGSGHMGDYGDRRYREREGDRDGVHVGNRQQEGFPHSPPERHASGFDASGLGGRRGGPSPNGAVEGPGRDENVGIGVRLRTVQGHFVVTAVDRDSAADAGGVEVEDVLLAIDGCSIVRVPPHAVRKLITGPVGTRVHLSLRRGTRTFTAALIRTPPNPESSTAPATDYGASRLMRRSPGRDDGRPAGLGMVLAWDKQHQVRVNLLNPDGPARRSGLVCKGDILWAVGEQRLIFRDVNDRAANMVKVKHLLSGANASQVVLTLQPADGGEKRRAVLFREIFSALQRFDDRLAMLQQSANEEVAAREAEQLRQTLKTCSGEVTPNLLLIGQPGHGKSSLLNTVFRAINKSTGSLACVSSMDENVTQDLEKYDDVVEESVHQPFVVYDTKGIGGDKRSAALLSSVITGRHGVGQRMDGGWWSRNRNVLKLHRDFVHGVVLVHDATQEVNPDVVDVVRTVCDAEGQVPVAVALTKIDVAQSQRLDVAARAAKLSELMPSAVFFPVVSYTKPTELGDGRIDLAVLSLFEQARTQGLRHLRFRHAERKWREIENA